jgi:CubicO group peptidase (beta-lactamase class C family)
VESVVSAPLDLSGRACNATYLATANTWAAGGAVSSAHDYAKLLHAFLAGGFITNMDDFLTPRTLNLARGYVPASTGSLDWQYALGSWNECNATTWNQSCTDAKVNSSPGAYGWLPWIDRQHGYYALIATRIAVGEGDTKSVPIEQQLQPLIVAAIAP